MKTIIVIFIITVLYTKDKSEALPQPNRMVSLGPIHRHVSIGNVSKKYEPLSPQDKKATATANELLRMLRNIFSVGLYPIPILDPYRNNDVRRIALPSDDLLSGNITINSFLLRGLRYTLRDIAELEVRLATERVDLNIFLLYGLYAEVDFVADLVVDNGIPFKLGGKLSARLNRLNASVALQAKAVNLGKRVYQMVGALVDATADDLQVDVSNVKLLDGIGSEKIQPWWEVFLKVADQLGVEALLSQVNEILRHFTVEQVKALLEDE